MKWLASACPQLQELHFSFCRSFSVQGFLEFVGFPQKFTLLDLSNCAVVTNSIFGQLRSQLINLRTLKLRNCKKISEMVGLYLALPCRELRLLDVRGCPLLKPAAFLRIFRAFNQRITILLDTPNAEREVVPIGYPGKERGLELGLAEVYHAPFTRVAMASSKSIAEQEPRMGDTLNVKKFIKAKVKKNLKKAVAQLQ
jgi:hypothetical protein